MESLPDKLDPDLTDLKTLALSAVNRCIDYQGKSADSSEKGYRSPLFLKSELPQKSTSLNEVYEFLQKNILDNPQFINTHPGFMGWSLGAGNFISILTEMINAAVSTSPQSEAQTITHFELELIDWMKQAFSWPTTGSGQLVSGSSMGNLLGLMAARHHLDSSIKFAGVSKDQGLCVVCSSQTHLTVKRALNILGLGEDNFINVPTGSDGKILIEELEIVLKNILQKKKILAFVATLGTTVFGNMENVHEIQKICSKLGIWLHIDAAWGAWLRLDKTRLPLTKGMELADSITFDFHKWPGSSIGCGLVLFRPGIDISNTLHVDNNYLTPVSDHTHLLGDFSLETSRPSRALTPWAVIKFNGLEKIGNLLQRNCDLIRFIYEQIKMWPQIEIPFSPETNSLVLRLRPENNSFNSNDFNREFAKKLWQEGRFMPSLVEINSKTFLKISFMNHRTTQDDASTLVERLLQGTQTHG